jgi:hypothetical protein
MGHSYVKFRDRVQMMNDMEVIIAVHVILDVTRKTPTSPAPRVTENIKNLLDSWEHLIDVYGPGMVGFNFSEFMQADEDRDCLLSLIDISRRRLQQFGAVVPAAYLNRVVDASAILEFEDRPIEKVFAAFDKFTQLLSG